MSTRVLVAYDESRQAEAALRHALEKFPEAALTVIHVNNPEEWMSMGDEFGSFYSEDAYELAQETAQDLMDEAAAIAGEYDRDVDTAIVMGRPSSEIVEYAEDNDVDHVVLGSHGRRGLNRFLLGSVAEKVVRRAPCPVTVIREPRTEEGE